MSKRVEHRLAVVANARSGRDTPRAGRAVSIGTLLAPSGGPHRLYATADLSELAAAAVDIRDSLPTAIAVVGGDGTQHAVLDRVIKEYETRPARLPMIIPVPTGTMNDVATSFGVDSDPERLARRVGGKLAAGEPCRMLEGHTLKVNGTHGFIYGAGLPVDFLRLYYEGRERNEFGAVTTFVDALCRDTWRKLTTWPFSEPQQMFHADVLISRQTSFAPTRLANRHTTLLAGTIEQIGLGCRALPRAREEAGHFMLRSSRLTLTDFAACSALVWSGLPLPMTDDVVVNRVLINFDRPTARLIDGEIQEPALCDVLEIGPRLRFIVG